MGRINTHDDRRWFECNDTGFTARFGKWSLTYTRIGSHLFQVGLVKRGPLNERPNHD